MIALLQNNSKSLPSSPKSPGISIDCAAVKVEVLVEPMMNQGSSKTEEINFFDTLQEFCASPTAISPILTRSKTELENVSYLFMLIIFFK